MLILAIFLGLLWLVAVGAALAYGSIWTIDALIDRDQTVPNRALNTAIRALVTIAGLALIVGLPLQLTLPHFAQ